MGLLGRHVAFLRASGLSDDVIEERGYRSLQYRKGAPELRDLGFSVAATEREQFPGILIPMWSFVNQEVWGYQYRPDHMRMDRRGRPVKYENPRGQEMRLDIAPRAWDMLEDTRHPLPLVVTEGAKKADCVLSMGLDLIPINLPGVGIWRTPGCQEEWKALGRLGDRDVYIAFDSDARTKFEVKDQQWKLGMWLPERFNTDTKKMKIPKGRKGEKQGLDDYLAAGKSIDKLITNAQLVDGKA